MKEKSSYRKTAVLWLTAVLLAACLSGCVYSSASETPASGTPVSTETEDDGDSILAALPEYAYDTPKKSSNMGDGSKMLVFYNAKTSDGYLQYQEDLKDAGYELYAENEITDNLFATWTNDTTTVTTMYLAKYENVYIVAEPTGDLPGLPEDNVYDDLGVENVVAQIGADYDNTRGNGMCYVYRLCDGSFIVVDSAFNAKACAKAIYETLRALAPDPENIVIAAWILTHAHTDHIGGFFRFSQLYGHEVTLERMIYNYPNKLAFLLCDVDYNFVSTTLSALKYYDNPELIEAHPGQKFYLRDAEIEMLYTWEMMNSTVDYFNNTSLVFTIDLGEEQIMQLGDCGPIASQVNAYLYEDYLKSDIIQVSHHGYIGASAWLNELIDADVVLWPSTNEEYERYFTTDYNLPLQEADVIYVADRQVTVIPLPYTADEVESWDAYHR